MKKLLLITFLLFFTFSYAQQNENNGTVVSKKEPPVTLLKISAYPNPFNVRTRINFRSTIIQNVQFTVKNMLGKIVYSELIDAKVGYNSVLFDRNNLVKGMYIYSLQTDSEIVSKRLVIK